VVSLVSISAILGYSRCERNSPSDRPPPTRDRRCRRLPPGGGQRAAFSAMPRQPFTGKRFNSAIRAFMVSASGRRHGGSVAATGGGADRKRLSNYAYPLPAAPAHPRIAATTAGPDDRHARRQRRRHATRPAPAGGAGLLRRWPTGRRATRSLPHWSALLDSARVLRALHERVAAEPGEVHDMLGRCDALLRGRPKRRGRSAPTWPGTAAADRARVRAGDVRRRACAETALVLARAAPCSPAGGRTPPRPCHRRTRTRAGVALLQDCCATSTRRARRGGTASRWCASSCRCWRRCWSSPSRSRPVGAARRLRLAGARRRRVTSA